MITKDFAEYKEDRKKITRTDTFVVTRPGGPETIVLKYYRVKATNAPDVEEKMKRQHGH
jgi:hypothetical protein